MALSEGNATVILKQFERREATADLESMLAPRMAILAALRFR